MSSARPFSLSVALALTATAVCAQARPFAGLPRPDAPSGVWRQWRGPARDGHCPGDWWPERLTEDRVERLWRVALGPSYSGPVVDETEIELELRWDIRDGVDCGEFCGSTGGC